MTKPRSPDHGLVLQPVHMNYSGMTRIGSVTVGRDPDTGVISVHVQDFDYAESTTCREDIARAMCWARDLLAAEIEILRLLPAGTIQVTSD